MVTFVRPLTVETSPALVRAPARDVSPASMAVSESDNGTVRTVSTMWTIPPVNFTSYKKIVSFLR